MPTGSTSKQREAHTGLIGIRVRENRERLGASTQPAVCCSHCGRPVASKRASSIPTDIQLSGRGIQRPKVAPVSWLIKQLHALDRWLITTE